ncbi:MAG TPA: hypothetical protein VF411_00805 [Bacteroidia bacterium]
MKNITITIALASCLLFLASKQASAQRKFKDYLLLGSTSLVSGMLDGTIESISYHYDNGFKLRFPKANNQFWNPAISWSNKYKNGNCNSGPKYMGSTDIFVCTTDAYHMLRTSRRGIDAFTIAYYVNKTRTEKVAKGKRWKNIAKDFLIVTALRCVGFTLTYSLLFKQHGVPVL